MPTRNSPSQDGQQCIEQLQQRFNELNTKKITAEANLTNAKKELEKLRKEALAKYQTDDVEKLRAQLAQIKNDNEEKRANYQQQLDNIERELASVEEKFAPVQASSSTDGPEK